MSATPLLTLKAESLYPNLDNTRISTWNGYPCYSVGGWGLPIFRCNENMPYVRFGDSTSTTSRGSYLNFGSQTFNTITILAYARFTASLSWQRLVDFGNGVAIENILIAQPGTSLDLQLSGYKPGLTEQIFDSAKWFWNEHLADHCVCCR